MDAEDLETAPLLQPPQLPTTVRLDIQSKKKIIKSEFLWTYWKSRSLRRHWVYQAAALVALLLSLSLMLAVTTVLLILRDRAQNGHKDIIIDVGGDRGRGEAQNNISGRSSIWETDEVQLPATSENPLPVGSIAVAVPSLICRNLSEDIVNIKGGSTVDAAIVAVLCSGLINSYASGVGGGAFMVIQPSIVSHEDEEQRRKLLVVDDDHDPQAGRGVFEKTDPVMIDCRETAPERSWATMFKENPTIKGGLVAGVPGELWCLHVAHKVWGKLPWSSLVADVILLADNGFAVPLNMELRLKKYASLVLANPLLSQVYAPNGQLLKQGDTCYRKSFAKALRLISKDPIMSFYSGEIASSLVATSNNTGGIVTLRDLESYRPVIRRPLQGSFKANDGKTYSIVAPQVPSAGPILVSLLNIYETLKQSYGVGLNNTDPNAWHGIVEAIKFGTAQKTRLGDPGFTADMDKFIAHVIDKRAAKDLVDAIDPVKLDINRTFSPDHYADEFMYSIPDEQGTCHISVLQRYDSGHYDAVSITTTVNYPFGGGVVDEEFGIILNNQMNDFSVPDAKDALGNPSNPANFPLPGRRPLSSMTPIVVASMEKESANNISSNVIVIGGSGGPLIFPSVFQSLVALLDFNATIKEAVSAPRLYHPLTPNLILAEATFSTDIVAGFKNKGHAVQTLPPKQPIWSLVQAAADLRGVIAAEADPRLELVGEGQ